MLLVEQNAALALRLADRAYVLEVGQVTAARRRGRARRHRRGARPLPRRRRARTEPPTAADRRRAPPTPGDRGAPRRPSPCAVDGHHACGSAASPRFARSRFAVAPGTVHALIGPNGAGKSTCLNVLSGVYRAAVRQRPLRRPRTHRAAPAPHRRPRRGPHLPEPRAVRRTPPSRTTCCSAGTGSPAPDSSRAGLRLPAAPAARSGASANASARSPRCSAWSDLLRPAGRPRCPTATASASSWPARCAPSRRCCCSTSPSPA